MSKVSTIQISARTKRELRRFSKGREPYEKVIRRLITLAEKDRFHERQKRILRTEKFVPLDEV